MKLKHFYFFLSFLFFTSFFSGCLNKSIPEEAREFAAKKQEEEKKEEKKQETIVERPSGVIVVSENFCVCLKQQSELLGGGSCEATCKNKTANEPTLFGEVRVGKEIELNKELGNLYNWCTKSLSPKNPNPSCFLETKNEEGQLSSFEITLQNNSNSFSINLQGSDYNTTYLARIVEKNSQASSQIFQFRRKKISENTALLPLKIHFIHEYSCLWRMGTLETTTGKENIQYTHPQHFYFSNLYRPQVIPTFPTGAFRPVVCHDEFSYGRNDSESYPRNKLRPGIFALWDPRDGNFVASPTSVVAINDYIHQEMISKYQSTNKTATIYFRPLNWPNGPQIEMTQQQQGQQPSTTTAQGQQNQSRPPVILGHYLSPWVDSQTGRSFCLTNYHYSMTQIPIFQVFKTVLGGLETEGLYVGMGPIRYVTNPSTKTSQKIGPDLILISETLLKKIWFYKKNDQIFPANDNVASTGETLHFFWPADTNAPYIQGQKELFTIRTLSEALEKPEDMTKPPETAATGDRKIGCIPKVASE